MGKYEPSEEQIRLYLGGVSAYLSDHLDKAAVLPGAFNNTQVVTPSTAQFSLIDSSLVSGNLSISTSSTTTNGGIFAAPLAGAVGTAATTIISNSLGEVLNLVDIRDATTNDPILDTDGRKVWGLIQCASTVTDGDAIGAATSENTQISYVKYDGTSSLVLVSLDQSVEFNVNYVYADRHLIDFKKYGTAPSQDIIDTTVPNRTETYYLVTTNFAAEEVINLTTGAGGGSGASTKTGVNPLLPTSSADFIANGNVTILRNGVEQVKGTNAGGDDVEWVSTTSIKFTKIVRVNETIGVKAQDSYPA